MKFTAFLLLVLSLSSWGNIDTQNLEKTNLGQNNIEKALIIYNEKQKVEEEKVKEEKKEEVKQKETIKPKTKMVYKWNTSNESFSKAKRLLYAEVYWTPEVKKTIYCGCSYTDLHNIDLKSCGLSELEKIKRANRIEAEHVVPAHAFGWSFKSWREGDPKCVTSKWTSFKWRNCARKVNKDFRLMEADLYNLYPAVWEVNGRRSNFSMAMIPWEDHRVWKYKVSCDIEVDTKIRKIEPKEDVRGDIARTYMYMDLVYPWHDIISEKNKKLYEAWAKLDPVSKEECRRYRIIKEIQGNENPILKELCEK